MSYISNKSSKITTKVLQKMKNNGEKISMLTAYDYTMAKILDISGIDAILVGDSASNVIAGNSTTIPITLDEMIYHSKCVVKAVKKSLVISDLPFGTYQGDSNNALKSSIRLMKEAEVEAIKLEGGQEVVKTIKLIVNSGIPVMGHLGLTPQSINKFGSYVVRAKEKKEADLLIENSKMLEEAGCFAIVLEKIPSLLAKKVTECISIPTIGIGAGLETDGQVLVVNDMLGMNNEFSPRFVRKYANLEETISNSIKSYINDVKTRNFPNNNEQY